MRVLSTKEAVKESSDNKLILIGDMEKTLSYCELLPSDEYYCLMVECSDSVLNIQYYDKNYPDASHNVMQGCIDVGLERTSYGGMKAGIGIYLSKDWRGRYDLQRGRTLKVRVVNPETVDNDFCVQDNIWKEEKGDK